MSAAEKRLLWKYLLTGLGAFAFGAITNLLPQLQAPPPVSINWYLVLAAGLTPVLPLLVASKLPRTGSAAIAEEVDRRRRRGKSRKDLTVVTHAEATVAANARTEAEAERAAIRNRDPERASGDLVLNLDPLVIQAHSLIDDGYDARDLMLEPRPGAKPRQRTGKG